MKKISIICVITMLMVGLATAAFAQYAGDYYSYLGNQGYAYGYPIGGHGNHHSGGYYDSNYYGGSGHHGGGYGHHGGGYGYRGGSGHHGGGSGHHGGGYGHHGGGYGGGC
ncbi:MAG: hypothetical protein M1438_14820 [Deltaproteobacteria bacterium]|nr:hypothetical protein [Deltaproteobacteria bacterium]